jgi:aspartyl protease family protein
MSASPFLYGGAAVVGLVLVGAQLHTVEKAPPPAPVAAVVARPATPVPAPPPSTAAFGTLTLKRAADSHFYADAEVNGARVTFLVDTGASSVVLTAADARRAGIGAGDYSARAIGAGGEIRLMPALATRLALGPVAADNVEILVAEDGKLPVSLLGQSFLARAGSVTIEGDRMVLR